MLYYVKSKISKFITMPKWLHRILGKNIKKPPQKKRRMKKEHQVGEYYFKETILDQLDLYFKYIKRMKKVDKEAYQLYSKYGAHVVPLYYEEATKLHPWWVEHLPSFGAISASLYEGSDTEETLTPKFFYFQKFANGTLQETQFINTGSTYSLTVYWDDLIHPEFKGAPTEFAVNVSNSGELTILKTLQQSTQTPPRSKLRKRGYRHGRASIKTSYWGFSNVFIKWAGDHDQDVENYLKSIFIMAIDSYTSASGSMTRIRAKKNNLSALFAINIERTPYFFKDRDFEANEKGSRKKIFHIVRGHYRNIKGEQRLVKMHFRGSKNFSWNNYKIEITVPGYDHYTPMSFNIESFASDEDLTAGMVGVSELADTLLKAEKSGKTGVHHNG